jgi:hypothetical protein
MVEVVVEVEVVGVVGMQVDQGREVVEAARVPEVELLASEALVVGVEVGVEVEGWEEGVLDQVEGRREEGVGVEAVEGGRRGWCPMSQEHRHCWLQAEKHTSSWLRFQ